MYCRNCGREIPDNSLYCPECGAKQEDMNTTVEPSKKEGTKVFGVLSLIFGLLGGVLGLVFGIIGLVLSKNKQNRIMCVIGIVAFICWMIIYILI